MATGEGVTNPLEYTCIELLVVIIIIGILAAISLPSYFSQVNKARIAEANVYVRSYNTGQIAHFAEKGVFTNDRADLDGGLPAVTANYTYTIAGLSANSVEIRATPVNASSKGVAGRAFLTNSGDLNGVVCVSNTAVPPLVATVEGTNGCP